MEQHVGMRELSFLGQMSARDNQNNSAEVASPQQAGFGILLAAFVLGELKEAFAMSFTLLVPFLVVDLIVANLLVGMGMFMLSPVMVALPVKLILFVLADGWLLIARGLVSSYSTSSF
jgi:flagellar biosynthetic protein FliP